MDSGPVSITVLHGIQHDPRVAVDTVIYGLGSYVRDPLSPELEFLYCTLKNTGSEAVKLESFFLQTGEHEPERFQDLDLPAGSIRGRHLGPGQTLGIGFMRDLLTKRLRWQIEADSEVFLRAGCLLDDGRQSLSAPWPFAPAYPSGPLQDVELSPYHHLLLRRQALFASETSRINREYGSLRDYASLHQVLGLHKEPDGERNAWVLREWMPMAEALWLTTDRIGFEEDEAYRFQRLNREGLWELRLPPEALDHGTYMELRVASPLTGGKRVRRVPAFATRVEQNPAILEEWCARVWDPPHPYVFRHADCREKPDFPLIYEAHVGLAQAYQGRTETSLGTYAAFTRDVLPRIRDAGYNAVQLMGILEHPLYKSFGYQVSSYFAPSSRFGTPEELCELIDTAHALGLAVILDVPHSHAAPNTEQGLARYDTSSYLFAAKDNQWGTLSYDYRQEMTRRFLLSNCRYWLETFQVDGFRFDAVGNMIYLDHGFGDDFSHQGRCFYAADGQERVDESGVLYLSLANALTHALNPEALTLAEEFSGMPGMTTPPEQGGLGFDYRFAMGLPDFWGSFIKQGSGMGALWHEMNNHRVYERSVSYVACHDQCINGKDAMIWRLIGDEMYTMMSCFAQSWNTARGVALYKLMRLMTFSTAGHGFLNFMGDEFGHPEWIDAGAYGHRQWHLPEQAHTRYAGLAAFDRDMLGLPGRACPADFKASPRLRHLHEADRTLAFERGRLLFAFNFHELEARQDLELRVTPGKYVELLSSDSPRYAGHGNLDVTRPPTEHFTRPLSPPSRLERVSLYLPPLVALVLGRE